MLSADTFRSVIGRFASGITIVTAVDSDGADHGMTATAFASVSLVPPLVLVCVDQSATMHAVLQRATHFSVSILAEEQEELSRRFGSGEPQRGGIPESDRFNGVGYTRGVGGAVLLNDALAHIECRVHDRHEAGDHMIVVGEVESAIAHDARPLLYYRSGYTQLEG
jgi:flavin reductase (DIM6/NTAB) family NADH-FMN oxidoreductase RutF